MSATCPCGSGRLYQECCGRFIEGTAHAETAEQLMRSRYTAYTLKHEAYLLASWHPSTRPPLLKLAEAEPLKWIGLKIMATQKGQLNDDEGWVEFVARYKVNGKAEKLHEKSHFLKQQQQWFYVDGQLE